MQQDMSHSLPTEPEPSAAERVPRRAARGGLESAILDEARRVLMTQGYTELSMRRIAAAIGVTPTSIYLYFQNKDALLHALIDEGMSRLHDELEAASRAARDPRERVVRLCRAYLEFGLEQPEFYELMFMLHPQHMTRYPAAMYRRARQNLRFLADALGELRGGSSEPRAEPDRDPTIWIEANLAWSTLHGALTLCLAGRLDGRLDPTIFLDAAVRRASNTSFPADPGADLPGVAEAS